MRTHATNHLTHQSACPKQHMFHIDSAAFYLCISFPTCFMISLRAFNHASAFAKCSLLHPWYVFGLHDDCNRFLPHPDALNDGVIVFCETYLLFLFMRGFFWQRSIKWKKHAGRCFGFLLHSINWLWHFIAVGKLFNSLIIRIKWFCCHWRRFLCPTILSIAHLRCFSTWYRNESVPKTRSHPRHAPCSCWKLINCLTAEIIFPN